MNESYGVNTRSRTLTVRRSGNDQHVESMDSSGKGDEPTVTMATGSTSSNAASANGAAALQNVESTVDTKQMLETFMVQNRMLMELLNSLETKSTGEITFAPDFQKSIPVFNGLNPGYQALDWLYAVNSVANLNRWPDNFKLQSVRINLDGPAEHWFSSRKIVSWIDFETQFKRTFVGEVSVGDRWKEILRCVQRKGESVLEYFHETVHLCSLLELSFQETKMQVLEGLFSKELSVHLLSRNHADVDELLNDVVNFERLDASRTLRI